MFTKIKAVRYFVSHKVFQIKVHIFQSDKAKIIRQKLIIFGKESMGIFSIAKHQFKKTIKRRCVICFYIVYKLHNYFILREQNMFNMMTTIHCKSRQMYLNLRKCNVISIDNKCNNLFRVTHCPLVLQKPQKLMYFGDLKKHIKTKLRFLLQIFGNVSKKFLQFINEFS